LTREKIDEKNSIYGHKGIRGEMFDWMIRGKTIERGPTSEGSDVPNVSYCDKLRNLQHGDNRAEEFREPECKVRVHEKVNKTIHEHAAALSAGVIHDIQEQKERRSVVIEV
jgi:hypothetical protein